MVLLVFLFCFSRLFCIVGGVFLTASVDSGLHITNKCKK